MNVPMSSEDVYLEEEDDNGSEDDDDGYGDYYTLADADHMADQFSSTNEQDFDPELSEYECLTQEQTEQFLKENVDTLANNIQIRPPLAKLLLHMNSWSVADVTRRFSNDRAGLHSDSRIALSGCVPDSYLGTRSSHAVQECAVCLAVHSAGMFRHLSCQHSYCQSCWGRYAEAQLHAGVATRMSCMATHCPLILPEDFILPLLPKALLEKFRQFAFRDYVKSHPLLRLCSGSECGYVIRAWEVCSKKVVCSHCHKAFCFQCGCEPHAPTDCNTIRRWLTKCADDSETANYISAHTKDCPKCHICIEKNGGCNHMQCYSCKFDFCWMCLQDWKLHGSEYYECSRYKENPNIVNESAHAQAREALKKYLFYFERWENHAKSLRLEQQTLQKIRERIQAKVMVGEGTWIDWQYLIEAAHLLAKCRYTLQYTYPYAYYMELGPRKELFEYQQAQLEAEIENLAWKVEHAETTHHGDLQNQMDVAAKRRATLLYHFSSL